MVSSLCTRECDSHEGSASKISASKISTVEANITIPELKNMITSDKTTPTKQNSEDVKKTEHITPSSVKTKRGRPPKAKKNAGERTPGNILFGYFHVVTEIGINTNPVYSIFFLSEDVVFYSVE